MPVSLPMVVDPRPGHGLVFALTAWSGPANPAAIPAVVSYNFFVGRIKTLATEMDTFGHDFMNIVQRSLLKS